MERRDSPPVVANVHYGGAYRAELEKAARTNECPLCRQVREDPEIILDRTSIWYVKRNSYPLRAGEPPHSEGDTRPYAVESFLIIPFAHITETEQLLPDDWIDVMLLFGRFCTDRHIRGGGLCLRFGEPRIAGRTILHIHFHVIMPPPNPSQDPERPVMPVWFPIG